MENTNNGSVIKANTEDDSNNHANEKKNVGPHNFIPKEVLKSGRMACIKGELCGESSLMLLEQREFTSTDLLSSGYSGNDLLYEQLFHNDIYSRYIIYPKLPHNGIKASIVSPCTQKHIDKYKEHSSYLILETPKLYAEITLPHLRRDQFNLQWVYNILSGEKEADRVVYKDNDDKETGFLLLPDLHWDGIDPGSLHLLALPLKHGILSIRDLNATHLPLLKNIRDKSLETIAKTYGISASCIRMYFHYQPTFYHLHVHITYLKHEAPGIFVEKAHLLDTVINNIELIGDYYLRSTLPFTVRETDTLYEKYKEAKVIEEK